MSTFEERYWAKVQKADGCWTWTSDRTRTGHGRIARDGRMVIASRVAWELAKGPIPDGLYVLHHCDNPPCVKTEPDARYPEGHLFLGTLQENARDAGNKGRLGVAGKAKTKCVNGHPYTSESTYRSPKTGRRQCNICRRLAGARQRESTAYREATRMRSAEWRAAHPEYSAVRRERWATRKSVPLGHGTGARPETETP